MVHRDIIIIGAGLSGIGAACHLSQRTQTKPILFSRLEPKLAVLGVYFNIQIRSDSDMYTFGYSFKTWEDKSRLLMDLLF
jgi:cation diffusion facilitator CzcD-associated flavoprotein CzcO